MKFALIALLAAVVVEGKTCRNDANCASNFTRKKCCSHFQCNNWCNTTRCRVDTCGKQLCAKTAVEFVTRMVQGRRAMPAIPARPLIAPLPAVPAIMNINGLPIPGSSRPALPGIPARQGRAAIPAQGMVTCQFSTEGIATLPVK